jgi:glutamate formiminotransferase/formiminotetrahydrofolate cyclodeaminase
MPTQIIECVPNFSEGRDKAKIRLITESIRAVPGVELLHVDAGADTNRTVVTFVGSPQPVAEAAFRAIAKAAEVIDMRKHHGAHPRIGAADVCPLVPIEGLTLEECAEIARWIGRRVGDELGIPVFFYEAAATSPQRTNLADIRQGEFEGLPEKLKDPRWKPDCGPAKCHPTAGATVLGAREFLIAYNITLNTPDKTAASDIALELRQKGRVARRKTASPYYSQGEIIYYQQGSFPCGNCDFVGQTFAQTEQHCRQAHGYELRQLAAGHIGDFSRAAGEKVRRAGKFQFCKAIGWYVRQYKRAQISINLTNFHVTPPHAVLEEARRLAHQRGLLVTGSEIVGLAPYAALLEAGKYYLARQGRSTGLPAADVLEAAVFSLGLNDVRPFELRAQVIGLPREEASPLGRMRLGDFADEVSSDTPAPGGGSVAALAGSLGAALAAMVANITHHKTADGAARQQLAALAEKTQQLKERLLRAVDEDAAAFDAYLQALRLPAESPQEQQHRRQRVQEGLKQAIEVPYQTALAAFEAMQAAGEMVRLGLPASMTDAAVGCQAAFVGVRGGVWNVLVNLKGIHDPPYAQQMRRQCAELLQKATTLLAENAAEVDGRLES